jgi:hypothetical protein
MNNDALYRWNKSLWLMMQALVLPMSAIYLSRIPALTLPNELLKILFGLIGSFLLILWLIAQALLIMHNFPLRLAPALRLTAGYLLSFLIIWIIESTALFAAYAAFFTTLLAMLACGAVLFFQTLKQRKLSAKQVFTTIPVFAALLIVTAWLFMPLLHGLSYMPASSSLATLVVLAINTISTTRALWEKTIFSDALSDQADQYSAEWEKWAGPTIITLILSATAAIIIFAILT